MGYISLGPGVPERSLLSELQFDTKLPSPQHVLLALALVATKKLVALSALRVASYVALCTPHT